MFNFFVDSGAKGGMMVDFSCGLPMLALLSLPGLLLGELVFRCPSCTGERQAACPKLGTNCTEIVREHGCGCCPVCARLEGEYCGVYTPRCSTGLRCYPSADSKLPLEQLVQGLGQCSRRVDATPEMTPDHRNMSDEIQGTDGPPQKKLNRDGRPWMTPKETAMRQAHNELKTKMKINSHPEEPRPPTSIKSPCQQELDKVLEDISKMTFSDNGGPLESLYQLKFPNCDRQGQYNMKQCHVASHGQRGECWCVNPSTGVQITQSTKVRGDPKCSQYYVEDQGVEALALPNVVLQVAEI